MDLEAAREDVVAEVFNAPKRRVDNEVSRLADAAASLHMHCLLLNDALSQIRKSVWRTYAINIFGWGNVVGIPLLLVGFGGYPLDVSAYIGAVGAVGMTGVSFWHVSRNRSLAVRLATAESFEAIFKRLYARKISERDEDTLALWSRISEILRHSVTPEDLLSLSKMSQGELNQLEKIIDVEIPNLRRAVGPMYNNK